MTDAKIVQNHPLLLILDKYWCTCKPRVDAIANSQLPPSRSSFGRTS